MLFNVQIFFAILNFVIVPHELLTQTAALSIMKLSSHSVPLRAVKTTFSSLNFSNYRKENNLYVYVYT